jgi:hypothetical protein
MNLSRFALAAVLLVTPSAIVWPAQTGPVLPVSAPLPSGAAGRVPEWRPRHHQLTELGISLRLSSRPPEQSQLRLGSIPQQPKPKTETTCRLVLNLGRPTL